RTAENFRQFCTGEYLRNNKPIGYKGCSFHRGRMCFLLHFICFSLHSRLVSSTNRMNNSIVVKGFMVQGGDFVNGDGSGSTSIYAEKFQGIPFFFLQRSSVLVDSFIRRKL